MSKEPKIAKLTKETIKNFDESAVEIVDCFNNVHRGWFIIKNYRYKLFPFDTIWTVHTFKLSHIKSIKHLTNNFELKE